MSYSFVDPVFGLESTMLVSDSPEEQADIDRRRGRFYGYPECCIDEFAADTLACRLSAIRRGTVPDGNGGKYVPCSACCEAMGRECADPGPWDDRRPMDRDHEAATHGQGL